MPPWLLEDEPLLLNEPELDDVFGLEPSMAELEPSVSVPVPLLTPVPALPPVDVPLLPTVPP
jgi:hypothetical protein